MVTPWLRGHNGRSARTCVLAREPRAAVLAFFGLGLLAACALTEPNRGRWEVRDLSTRNACGQVCGLYSQFSTYDRDARAFGPSLVTVSYSGSGSARVPPVQRVHDLPTGQTGVNLEIVETNGTLDDTSWYFHDITVTVCPKGQRDGCQSIYVP